MRRLYLYPNGLLEKESKVWFNFRKGISPHAAPGEELEEKYNGKLVNRTEDHRPYIEFKTDKDYTFFILKWS